MVYLIKYLENTNESELRDENIKNKILFDSTYQQQCGMGRMTRGIKL